MKQIKCDKNSVKLSDFLRKRLYDLLQNEKWKNLVIICGVIGITLILFSTSCNLDKGKKEQDTASPQKGQSESYAQALERSLQEIISSIKGAGKTKILITTETDVESIYATEEKSNNEETVDNFDGETTRQRTSNDVEKKYITTRDCDGTERALKITEVQPKIKGVIVLCQGGEVLDVKKKIIEAVTTVLNISSKKVYVTNCA